MDDLFDDCRKCQLLRKMLDAAPIPLVWVIAIYLIYDYYYDDYYDLVYYYYYYYYYYYLIISPPHHQARAKKNNIK